MRVETATQNRGWDVAARPGRHSIGEIPECHAFGYGPSRWFCPIHSPLKPEMREPPGPSGDPTHSHVGRDESRARSRSLADVYQNDLRYELVRLASMRVE